MPPIIQISNLSKIYRLGEIGTGTITRDLERWYMMKIRRQEDPFLKIGEANDRKKKGISDMVYSLKDINFEIKKGEALGIIGKNGAGKSTLLKIISRITSPTTGKINIKGRIASLLEVGTGFHPELTGRENIYLNGAILGMLKREITQKLDEIIEFSGVERYIDTPVKRYSSGMYVRLAFAVAAHLESEILLIDEVLAVGDAEFQKKCLGKMDEVAKDGRTVIFVSHNMGAIQQLCTSAVVLDSGRVTMIDSAYKCVNEYISGFENMSGLDLSDRTDRTGNGYAIFEHVSVIDIKTKKRGFIEAGNTAIFEFKIKINSVPEQKEDIVVKFSIFDSQFFCIAHCSNLISGDKIIISNDFLIISCIVNKLPLNRGYYSLSAYIGTLNDPFDYIVNIANFQVESGSFYSTNKLPETGHSSLLLDYRWNPNEYK